MTEPHDYSYDLAHEVPESDQAQVEEDHPVQVATESTDLDQDYSYDLAHDIPRS